MGNSKLLGSMGKGSGGCEEILGYCGKNTKSMKCEFGYCPIDFTINRLEPACTLTSACHSFCGTGNHKGNCNMNIPKTQSGFSIWMKKFEN